MKTDELIAIDIHTHAEVSCWNPFDNYGEEYDRAADKYFGSDRRPTIDESVAYYRERKIGLVMFTVDSETQLGRQRIPNEEIRGAHAVVVDRDRFGAGVAELLDDIDEHVVLHAGVGIVDGDHDAGPGHRHGAGQHLQI